MPASPIYLDHAATTPLDPQVREAMAPFWETIYGNPSSLHRWGREAKKAMESARSCIAECLNATPDEIIFTSGGTEANNQALLGVARHFQHLAGRHLITSSVEHPSVLNPCRALASQGWKVTCLPVDSEGRVSVSDLEAALCEETVLVSIMHGNNEIGTLQPIEAIGTLLKRRGIFFHTDAVQTAGKLPLDLAALPVDALTLSGHKLYGPKGTGLLYVRKTALQPQPLLLGGGQESDRRSGTENLPGLVGLAAALQQSLARMPEETPRLYRLQESLIQGIEAQIPGALLNGPRNLPDRVPGNVNFSFPPSTGDALVLQMDMKGIAVSSGSACHSAVIEPSHVVLATGQSEPVAQSTLRFSLGRGTRQEDLEAVLAVLPGIVERLGRPKINR